MSNYEYYLDYLNNFLTIEAFANYYNLGYIEASNIIENGRIEAWGY